MYSLDESNPSAALRVWDHMGTLYDVTPESRGFAVMRSTLHVTRRSAVRHFAEMGTAMTESLDRARRRTYEQLEKSPIVNEGDM
jgi:hypothetical protein